MQVSFLDQDSGKLLHVAHGLSRADFQIGDRISLHTDQQFSRAIEVAGVISSVTLQLVDVAGEASEPTLIVGLALV